MTRTVTSGHHGARACTVAVTSGKGGVGKTSIVVNLAVALAQLGRRVGILDADLGLANVDVLLGLAPIHHLGHLLNGEKDVREVVVDGPLGVKVIPASSGIQDLAALTPVQWKRLGTAIECLSSELDFLLLDTAPGISGNVINTLSLADRVLIVTSLEPTAIVDAYAMIKILSNAGTHRELGILVNAVRDADEARLVFEQLDIAAARFLNRRLTYYGFVQHDPAVRESVLVQRPLVDHLPQAPASRSFRVLASRLSSNGPSGGRRLQLVPTPRPTTASTEVEAPRCA